MEKTYSVDMFAVVLLSPSADQQDVRLSNEATNACESYCYGSAGTKKQKLEIREDKQLARCCCWLEPWGNNERANLDVVSRLPQ